MKVKIQLQNTLFYPAIGGIENYLYYVSKTLLKLRHRPIILCSQNQKNLPEEDICEGVRVIRRPLTSRIIELFMMFNQFYYENELKKFIERNLENIDIIWVRHPYYAYASCKALPKKPIIYIQATVWPFFLSQGYNKLNRIHKIMFNIRKPQNFYLEKQAMNMCNQIVVLSKIRMKEISDYYEFSEDKFKIIPPGIDLKRFKARNRDSNLLEKLDIDKNAKIVLTVCRLAPGKNVEMLIKAFNKINFANTYLLIVGDGQEKIYLQQLAKDLNITNKVRFLGFRKDVERFYSIADVFVLTSKYEGFGHVYLEAMASGLPCIGLKSDYPKVIVASEEIIIDGETGYCVNPYSIEDLAEKIEKIISDDSLRQKMGGKSIELCKNKYSWEVHVKELIKLSKDFTKTG